MPYCNHFTLLLYLVVLLIACSIRSSHAFVVPVAVVKTAAVSTTTRMMLPAYIDASTTMMTSWWITTTTTTTASTASLLLSNDDEQAAVALLDDPAAFTAFTDQVDFLDGPIKLMLGIFAAVIVVLAALSVVSQKVDQAIVQTIQDFEVTCKTYFPTTWQTIDAQLDGLRGEERDVKLLQIMEDLQAKEPETMIRIREKMSS